MPVNDIISQALDNNPLKVKQAFEDEMTTRVRAALNQKYTDMTAEVQPELDAVADLAAEPAEEEPAIDLPS